MAALASLVGQAAWRAHRQSGRRRQGRADAVRAEDRSAPVRDHARTVRSWPLLVLAVPAAAEVWSGWVGIAQKTGFGMVSLLPGIWPSLHMDTAVTLPVGVECYAAYALRAWLAADRAISDRTRRFAKCSAIFSFALGMAGQVAFHLMDQDHITKAPWAVTTLVSCLPVLVLGMGTALAHMLREDASATQHPQTDAPGPATRLPTEWSRAEQSEGQPDQTPPDRTTTKPCAPDLATPSSRRHSHAATEPPELDPDVAGPLIDDARRIARELAHGGQRISRRALRSQGSEGPMRRLTPSRSDSATS
jgi:hypothetical protein